MVQHQVPLLQLGIVLVFIGIIIIFISLITAAATAKEKDKGKSNFKFSVVGFLGFIPFGFGNDKRLLIFGIILTVIVVAATIILFSRSLKP
ncbi:MAG: DUF131 domain-containing protein [Nanoarchaeota archaeon]